MFSTGMKLSFEEFYVIFSYIVADSGSNDVETKLSSAKKSVADLAERQSALEATLAGFAQSNMPELLFSADLKLAKRLLHTGLVWYYFSGNSFLCSSLPMLLS